MQSTFRMRARWRAKSRLGAVFCLYAAFCLRNSSQTPAFSFKKSWLLFMNLLSAKGFNLERRLSAFLGFLRYQCGRNQDHAGWFVRRDIRHDTISQNKCGSWVNPMELKLFPMRLNQLSFCRYAALVFMICSLILIKVADSQRGIMNVWKEITVMNWAKCHWALTKIAFIVWPNSSWRCRVLWLRGWDHRMLHSLEALTSVMS